MVISRFLLKMIGYIMMPFNGTSNIGESLSREKDYEVVWDTFDMLLNKKQLNNNFKW